MKNAAVWNHLSPVSWWSGGHSASAPLWGLSNIWHWALWPVQQRATANTPCPPFPLTARHSFCPSLSCQKENDFGEQKLLFNFFFEQSKLKFFANHLHSFSSSSSVLWETRAAQHLFPVTTADCCCGQTFSSWPLRPNRSTEKILFCKKTHM